MDNIENGTESWETEIPEIEDEDEETVGPWLRTLDKDDPNNAQRMKKRVSYYEELLQFIKSAALKGSEVPASVGPALLQLTMGESI
jgi:hypothetical protein